MLCCSFVMPSDFHLLHTYSRAESLVLQDLYPQNEQSNVGCNTARRSRARGPEVRTPIVLLCFNRLVSQTGPGSRALADLLWYIDSQ